MLYVLNVVKYSMTYSSRFFAFTCDFRKSGFHKITVISSFSELNFSLSSELSSEQSYRNPPLNARLVSSSQLLDIAATTSLYNSRIQYMLINVVYNFNPKNLKDYLFCVLRCTFLEKLINLIV